MTQTGKKFQKENTSRRKKNHPERKSVLNSRGKGYQSFPQPLWLSGHRFRHCSPTTPGGCAVTSLAGAPVKSDPQFDHRHSSVIFEVDGNQDTSTQAVPAQTREAGRHSNPQLHPNPIKPHLIQIPLNCVGLFLPLLLCYS